MMSSPLMFAPDELVEKARSDYGRTIQQVLSREPQEDIYSIIGAIEVLIGSKIRKGLATSVAERMVFGFVWLAREVQNGGFHQYFFNSAGDFWKDVSEGLKSIGDEKGAALFQDAISIFPESTPSTDRFARQEQLSELDEKDEDRTCGVISTRLLISTSKLHFRTGRKFLDILKRIRKSLVYRMPETQNVRFQ